MSVLCRQAWRFASGCVAIVKWLTCYVYCSMTVDRTREIDRILCVAINNSPVQGNFFKDPGSVSPQVFQTASVAAQLVYEQVRTYLQCGVFLHHALCTAPLLW